MAFLGLWLILWIAGEASLIRISLGGFAERSSAFWPFFMIFWLSAWTLMGAWGGGLLLWHILGKEIIELDSTTLKQRKEMSLFSRSREYAVANIMNLRPIPPLPWSFWFYRLNLALLSFRDGAISFEYGCETHYLASGLEAADAKYAIEQMCRQAKSLHVARDTEQSSSPIVSYPRYWPIVENDGSALRITMPVASPPFVSLVLGGLLAGWIIAELSGIIALLDGAPVKGQQLQLLGMSDEGLSGREFIYFMLSWLAFGAILIVLFAGLFLWSIAGREVIELNSTKLQRIWQIPGFNYSREYAVTNITDLRPAPMMLPLKYNGQKVFFLKLTGGGIIFDYSRSTHYLGIELDETDARYVIAELCKRVRSLCP